MNAQTIADKLEAKSSGPDSWMAKCPAHEDHKPSLSIKSTGDKVLLKCFAGCTTDAVCAALGITVKDLFNKPATAPAQKKIVATYDYTDEAGALLYQVVRFDPKDFRQRKPDGKNGWDWKIGDTRRVLFRLPDVVNAIERDATIFICEGEKDCLALAGIGLCASCNAGGAESSPTGKKWLPDYTAALSGASVVILPDRDAPGRLHAQIVATHLHGVAASVRIVELPDHNGRPVKDAADFVAAGGTTADIAGLVEGAELFTGAAPVADDDAGDTDPLVERFGPPQFTNGKGEVSGLNERYWAGLYATENKVLHDPDERSFYIYNPSRGLWQIITQDAIREAVSTRIMVRSRDEDQPSLAKQITTAKLKGIVSALSGIVEKRGAFQEKRRIIHVRNGVVRFTPDGDVQFGGFDPDDFSRNQSPYEFDETAECPRFLAELIHPAVSADDADLIQRWAGLALFGYNLPQRFMVLDGTPGGGKGTLVKIIQSLVGIENSYQLRTDCLNDRFEMYRYRGKTMLIGPDVAGDFLMHKGASRLKVLVGGDPLSVEAKGSNQDFAMFGTFNILITCNSRLQVRLDGDVGAWRRRLLIVRYENPPVQKRILDFERLLLREEGPGILRWALAGFVKLQADFDELGDFRLTDAQRGRVESLLAESDSLPIFIRDRLVKITGGTITTGELMQRYSEFCADQKWNALPAGVVEAKTEDLMLQTWQVPKAHSIERDGKKANRGWRGVAFKEELTDL